MATLYIFGRSVNPIPTREGRLSPPITTGTPNVFHLPASLRTLHENRKPFKCEICDKGFGQNSILKKHILSVHVEKKPYYSVTMLLPFGIKRKPYILSLFQE